MYGVYFINRGDDQWTKLLSMPTEEEAIGIMSGFSKAATKKFDNPPYCVAISKGRDEEFVPRSELKAVPCG